MKPYISVIITEYRPRGFLKYAIRSVLNQSLNKDLYEIVLVKLRRDGSVDRLVEESGGKVLYLTEAPIGYYLYRGIQVSNGDVLVFLDDDAFVTKKLSYIYDLFSHKSNLGYYHHLAYIIDSRNKVVGRLFGGPREIVLIDPRNARDVRSALLKYGVIGSLMSATAIRRDVVEPFLDKLKSLITHPDPFMFLAALNSRYLMFHEPLELSYYRVHGNQVSLPRGSGSIDTLRRFAYSAVINQHGLYYLREVFPQITDLPLRHHLLGAYHYNVLGLIVLGLDRRLVSSTGIIVLWRGFFDKSPYRVSTGLLSLAYVILPRRFIRYLLVKYYGG